MAMHLLTPLTPQERSDILAGFSVWPGSRADATHAEVVPHEHIPVYYYQVAASPEDWYYWDSTERLWVTSKRRNADDLFTRAECRAYVLLDQYAEDPAARAEVEYILPADTVAEEVFTLFYKPDPEHPEDLDKYLVHVSGRSSNSWIRSGRAERNIPHAFLNPEYKGVITDSNDTEALSKYCADDVNAQAPSKYSSELKDAVLGKDTQAPSRYNSVIESTWLTKPAWHLALGDAEYFTPETATNHSRYFKRNDQGEWFTTPDIRYPVENLRKLENTFGFKSMEWTPCAVDPSSLPMVQKPNTTSPENDLDNW